MLYKTVHRACQSHPLHRHTQPGRPLSRMSMARHIELHNYTYSCSSKKKTIGTCSYIMVLRNTPCAGSWLCKLQVRTQTEIQLEFWVRDHRHKSCELPTLCTAKSTKSSGASQGRGHWEQELRARGGRARFGGLET